MTTSYLSISEFPGDGVTTEWEFNFAGGYISRDHVRAYIKSDVGVITPYDITSAFISDFKVSVTPAVPIGSTLRVYRDTPREEPIVNFTGGSNFTEANLDLLARQTIFAVAEAFDAGAYAAVNDLLGAAGSALAAAVAAQESTTLSETNAMASALSAANSLAAALVAKDTAVAAASTPGVAAVLANLTAVQNAATNAATATAKAGEASASASAASASAVSANGSAVTATAQAVIAALRAAESANSALISAANNEAARAPNILINGRMWNAPDGVDAWTNPANNVYMLGLWRNYRDGTNFAYNVASARTGPVDCPSTLRFTCTTAAATLLTANVVAIQYYQEAYDSVPLVGKTFTIRGQVYSSVPGFISVAISPPDNAYSYVFPVSAVAGKYTEFEHTIIGGLTPLATWPDGNTFGVRLKVVLAAHSGLHAPTASTWVAGSYMGLAGQINAVGVIGRVVEITDLSLCLGTAKPAVESFALDARRMERYFRQTYSIWSGYTQNSITNYHIVHHLGMRSTPMVTVTSGNSAGPATSPALGATSPDHTIVTSTGSGAGNYNSQVTLKLEARF